MKVLVIGPVPEIEISAEEFHELLDARRVLSAVGAIEQKFEIFLSNYLEMEKEILRLSAEQMVRGEVSYERMFESQMAMNRMLINLLTTSRLYVDQVLHLTKQICGHEGKAEVKKMMSAEYDGNFEYRFMEALRNYVQHSGFPVHAISFPSDLKKGMRNDFVSSFEFSALKEILGEDGTFKATVLAECPAKIDLKSTTRSYLESFGRVHDLVRTLIKPFIEVARPKIENAIQKYEKVSQRKPLGLSGIEYDDRGEMLRSFPLLLDWDNIRLKLAERNKKLVNMSNRCVSSAIRNS